MAERAESKAPCAPLQCLPDKDALSYLSPEQDPSLDCHTYILAEDFFPKWKVLWKLKCVFQLCEAHSTPAVEKHFSYFTARPQMSFKLGMTFLDCSILSFLHIFISQGDTHLLHGNFVCQSVCSKKPEKHVCMLSLMLEVFFKH